MGLDLDLEIRVLPKHVFALHNFTEVGLLVNPMSIWQVVGQPRRKALLRNANDSAQMFISFDALEAGITFYDFALLSRVSPRSCVPLGWWNPVVFWFISRA